MTGLQLVSVFMIGLLGSVHCVGMCGGIVSAFSMTARRSDGFPVAVVTVGRAGNGAANVASQVASLRFALAYNAGRIASYATAGAAAGGLAQSLRLFGSLASLQIAGYLLANLMLVALGLYLMNAWHGLARIEAAGQAVWRRIRPLTAALLPLDTPRKALALGALWGWVPCGMVYSVLLTAMMSGSAVRGAAVMIAFGLGTLPMLLGMLMLGTRLQSWTRNRRMRLAGGALVLAFGLLGLLRAAHGLPTGWIDGICIAPAAGAW